MDLNIEDLNKVISAFVSNECSDALTEQCLKKLILYTSENDILLSHLSSILISCKNQINCLFKSLTALHYNINNGDQKFLHYLASNNLNFVNLDKHKYKFTNVDADYLTFMKRYIKYLQQKISVYKFINMESSWLTKLTQKTTKSTNSIVSTKNDESVLQHDIIGEQLMRKIGFIQNQIDYLITEFNVENLNLLITNNEFLENNDLKTKLKFIELVFKLLLTDVINYANYYQDIINELIEQFELMNKKHCKDTIEIYRKLPDKIEILRIFLMNCNQNLMKANGFEQINVNDLIKPSIEMQEKMEHHWRLLESKPKRKNSERRKEKSKYAARVRRGEESTLLNELNELVPLPDIKLQDKASVMRLAIAFINTKQFAQNYFQIDTSSKMNKLAIVNDSEDLNEEWESLDVLKTSNLILTLLSLDGDLVFISPNVINLIGLKQTEMLGYSIFDFVHPCDHEELRNSLKQISEGTNNGTVAKKITNFLIESTANQQADARSENLIKESKYVSFMVRIKCTLNNKSKCVPLKSANYKMASFSGYLKQSKTKPLLVLSIDILLSPSAQLKCAGSSVFVTKHTPDLKFINTDEKLTSLFGYDEKELIGYSFFQYIHASDSFQLFNSFQKLLSKGEVETGYYRFLCKTGGYFWLQTKASLLTDYSTQKPQTILCVHHLLSELILSGVILSSKQLLETSSPNENLSPAIAACKKASKITKKSKSTPTQLKITKANLNSKVTEKCYSPVKANKKNATDVLSSINLSALNDDILLLKENSSLNNITNEIEIDDEINSNGSKDLDHFVQDCQEFDNVLEKIKFKEQFKKQFEAELNSRMTKHTVEPLFNTFSVFSPMTKEDAYSQQIEPSIDNSPLIATPSSIAYANKVDMTCMEMNFEPLSNKSSCLNYDNLSSPPSLSSTSSLTNNFNCETLDSSTKFLSSNIPESDKLRTIIGSKSSIFSPLTDDTNNSYHMACGIDSCEENSFSFDENKIDYEGMNLIDLAPAAGDTCVSLDFNYLPDLDPSTEKLIKEISFWENNSLDSNSSFESSSSLESIPSNQVQIYSFETNSNSSKKSFDYSNYISNSKSVKIPNHFSNLESEITKKPRTSFNLSVTNHQAIGPNSKINSSSVLLNLLVNGEDSTNGYGK